MVVLLPIVFLSSFLIVFYLTLHFWLHDFNISVQGSLFPKSKKKRKKIMAVFPHPDDETCVAATPAYLSPLPNTTTVLLTLTKGEQGYWERQKFSKDQLKKIREKELRKAARRLKIDRLIILDYVSQATTEAIRKLKNQRPIRLYWVVVSKKITKIIEGAIQKKLNPPEPEFCLSFFRLGSGGLIALHKRYLAFICHKSQFAFFRSEVGIPFWLANLIMHRDYFYWKKI